MKIAIDIRPLKSEHNVRGVGFYLVRLKEGLLKQFPKETFIFFNKTTEIKKDVDLIHYPYFDPFFLTLPFDNRKKTVVTVHDLIPLLFPQNFPAGARGKFRWEIQKRLLKGTGAIITDSQSSKKDIVDLTHVSEEKVHVVYLAAAKEFRKIENPVILTTIRKKYTLPDRFILYVGDVTWNKNLPRLVKVATKLRIPLVMVGKALIEKDFDRSNPWNQDRLTVEKLARGNPFIVRLGFLSLPDLVAIYNAATVFVMPSLYEGFGLPALEAMQCGAPVVVSKKGSLPEVVGKAGYYVNAEGEDDIASGIQSLYNDRSLQQKLRGLSKEQAKLFSWEKTCRETMQVYEHAVNNG